MKLYIEVKDGIAQNHPAFEDNLIEAFNFIPEHWEPFTRIERPTLGVYDLLDSDEPVYQKVDGVWSDVWMARPMTAKEKTAKHQDVITAFNSRAQANNWSSWVLDETTCTMVPPIPRLELDYEKLKSGIFTVWCGVDNNWKDTPVKPENINKFDYVAWQWVEVTE